MATPIAKGRIISRAISDSKKFAQLSPQAAVLFCMLIPHYTSHGKMNGDPGYIKAEVCPRIPYLTIANLPGMLDEISAKTNVKWFAVDGRYWIHSTKFLSDHQKLRKDRLGDDLLPDYSRTTPGPVRHEVEVEVEVEVQGEEEVEVKSRTKAPQGESLGDSPAASAIDAQAWGEKLKGMITR